MPDITSPDSVSFVRSELADMLPRYKIVSDCVEQNVKASGEVYLPKPVTEGDAAENDARYAPYLQRAVFYNVTGRTLVAMLGQIFSRPPIVSLPGRLGGLANDATGTGVSLDQLAREQCDRALSYGRAGILIDYSRRDGVTTVADVNAGRVAAKFATYAPQAIINWRNGDVNGRRKRVLVVLKETVEDTSQEFALATVEQWRVLRLRSSEQYPDGFYTQALYRAATDSPSPVPYETEYTPLDATGKPFDEIPFEFIGAVNNDDTVDPSPLYDMAELNIGHYRNSADYEEACFVVGQPTLWMAGLDTDWVTVVMKDKPVMLGSRRGIPLPVGGACGLLQVSPNSMPMEAMRHKEAQMVAMGAKLVENRQVRRTAFETNATMVSETSVLATIATNVSDAIQRALRHAARFLGEKQEPKYELNKHFALASMSIEERSALIADVQTGLIGYSEAREQLRRVGLASENDETVRTEYEARLKAEAEAKTGPATPSPGATT